MRRIGGGGALAERLFSPGGLEEGVLDDAFGLRWRDVLAPNAHRDVPVLPDMRLRSGLSEVCGLEDLHVRGFDRIVGVLGVPAARHFLLDVPLRGVPDGLGLLVVEFDQVGAPAFVQVLDGQGVALQVERRLANGVRIARLDGLVEIRDASLRLLVRGVPRRLADGVRRLGARHQAGIDVHLRRLLRRGLRACRAAIASASAPVVNRRSARRLVVLDRGRLRHGDERKRAEGRAENHPERRNA